MWYVRPEKAQASHVHTRSLLSAFASRLNILSD